MNVALIPARGGSKSIPKKNIRNMNGKPLIYWVIKAANECKYIDIIYVATEDTEIKKSVEKFGLSNLYVVDRSFESASDTASTEYVMLEFAANYEFDNIALLQATSPLLTASDLDLGFEKLNDKKVDSVLSVVEQKRFIWKENGEGYAIPQNYDFLNRPRRQEFEGFLVENGAFYITRRNSFIKSKARISGNIVAVKMSDQTYLEIDEPDDFDIVEKIMLTNSLKKRYQTNRNKIKLFLTDCDGCLTDGGMYLSEFGDELKKFNAKDGQGFQLLREAGIKVGIISGENVHLLYQRALKLKVDYIKLGVKDKSAAIIDICKDLNIDLNQVAYVGDDLNDMNAMQIVGYSCSVSSAIECIKNVAKYVSPFSGGNGAIRDCIEHLFCQELI